MTMKNSVSNSPYHLEKEKLSSFALLAKKRASGGLFLWLIEKNYFILESNSYLRLDIPFLAASIPFDGELQTFRKTLQKLSLTAPFNEPYWFPLRAVLLELIRTGNQKDFKYLWQGLPDFLPREWTPQQKEAYQTDLRDEYDFANVAAENNQLEMLQTLKKHDFDYSCENLADIAVKKKNVSILRWILQDEHTSSHLSAILGAFRLGAREIIEEQKDKLGDFQTGFGKELVSFYVGQSGSREFLDWLRKEKKFQFNLATLLKGACHAGQREFVDTLFYFDEDIEEPQKEEEEEEEEEEPNAFADSIPCFAARGGHFEIFKYLVEEKKYPLLFHKIMKDACAGGNVELVSYLLDKYFGKIVDEGEEEEVTEEITEDKMVTLAIQAGNIPLLDYLVNKKKFLIDYDSAKYAAQFGHFSVLLFLKNHQKPSFEFDSTCLYSAVVNRQFHIVRYLISSQPQAAIGRNVRWAILKEPDLRDLWERAVEKSQKSSSRCLIS
jgi:hypothetical protein